MSLGKKIKQLRKAKDLTQNQLANLLGGISESTISLYESEKRQPDYNTLIKIADFFDVSLDYLLGRTEKEKFDEKAKPEEDIFEVQLAANMEAEYGQPPSPELVALAKKVYKKVLKEMVEESAVKKSEEK